MKWFNGARTLKARVAIATVVALSTAGVGVAMAATSSPPSNAVSSGRGINEFGMTRGYLFGHKKTFTYSKGFFCDTSVKSAASTKCEAGEKYRKAPAKDFDPLYITVPLGFDVKMHMIDCPNGLVCVDHPGTIDLSRLEPALKPLYPNLTDAQLTAALKNYAVPGHDHFLTTDAAKKAEWWDVRVIGVTSPKTWHAIQQHRTFGYVNRLLEAKNPTVVGPIPTNLFLFFASN
jgi:hypothetical protein